MDLPKFHPNERVDLGDIEFLSTGQLGEFQRLQTNLIVGEAVKRILDGFSFAIFSPTVMTISFGKAILAENRQTAVRYGQLVGGGSPVEGVASQNVSFSGIAAAYSVFVRFVYGDGVQSNRAFWDTILAQEEVQAVNTRKVAGWQAIVALTVNDPGADWLRIVDIAWDGSALGSSVITDKRTFLFEGPADSTPQSFRPTWGGGADRNAARATNGVKTLERFASAVLKKIEEIQSDTPTTRWWDAPVEPLSKKVSRFGDLLLVGNYKITGGFEVDGGTSVFEQINPDVTNRGMGTSLLRWDAFLRDLNTTGAVTVTGTLSLAGGGRTSSSIIPDFDDGYTFGDASFKWSDVYTNFLHAGQIRRQPAILTADIGTSVARFRKLWFESGDFSAGLTAFGPISFGSTLTTDGSIFTSGATRDLGTVTSAGTRWNVFANTLNVLAAATFAGTLAPSASGVDLGSLAARWDVFGGTGNFSGTLTSDDIEPSGSGKNIGSGNTAATRYSNVYCTNINVGTLLVIGAGSGTDINLASAGNVLNVGGRVWFFGGTNNKESQIQLDQDFIGPDDDGNTSLGAAGVTSDVGIMMTFRSSNARVAGTVSPTADRQLHIATTFGPTSQCGAIKVQLQDGAGGTQTRGFIRVWFTPVG
jgi:hypothetical protein